MKVLIIGGTKFIGPYVMEELYNRGFQVVLFHRGKSIISTPPGVKEIYGDRKELARHKAELREAAPDIVLDMIAMNEDDAHAVCTVFRGVARRIVMVSSLDVYLAHARILRSEPGMPVAIPIAETGILRKKFYPFKEINPALTDYDKLLAERAYQSRRPSTTIVRLPVVYGPGDYQHRIYPYLKRMDDNRPFILIDRDQTEWEISRGYVKDVARAIALAVDNDNAAGKVYNVAEPKAMSELAWAKKIAQEVGWKGKFIALPKRKLPPYLQQDSNFRQSLVVETARIRRDLGYKESETVEKRLQDTIKWERRYPPEDETLFPLDYALEDECANYSG